MKNEITEIEFSALNGKIDMWWGNEDKIFGELKIELDALTDWIDEKAPIYEQRAENYTGSDYYYVPGSDEVQTYGADVFTDKDYSHYQYDKIKEYLKYCNLIA